MSNTFFNIFPNENFIDLCMYQFGYEQCDPGHSFGPATRNHYLFHYILSGTGTLMADNSKGETRTYSVKSGQGFMIFPGQINTYIADEQLPWEYMWIEFDGLRALNDCRMNQQVFEKLAKELDGTTGRRMEIKNCPVCGQPLKKRNGRFGEFWGCTGFPKCRYTENI